jgi:sugar phosphate isomerase/epimerase
MKIGLCTGLENLELVSRLGFDYIECAVSSVAALGEEEFEKYLAAINASPIKAERMNLLFPGGIRLIGPEKDIGKIDAYMKKAFTRAAALGAKTLVFGSGGARSFPTDIPFSLSYRELIAVTKRITETAAQFGLNIAIEPLNRGETNCINSLKEGAMLEACVDSSAIGLLADLFHIQKDNESLDNILLVKRLAHTHVAQGVKRLFPVQATEDVEAFFAALEKIAYKGTMSIEGNTENLERDAALSLAVLRLLSKNFRI